MPAPVTTPAARIAVDLGAESGRVELVWLVPKKDGSREFRIREVHRFANRTVSLSTGLHWDIAGLWREIVAGLRLAGEAAAREGIEIRSVGVDSWGVDWAMLDGNGELLGLPHAYRDTRNPQAFAAASRIISPADTYKITGIQVMAINSFYSLHAMKLASPELVAACRRVLFIPDLLHYWLCGVSANELTIASTSQMLEARTANWSGRLLEIAGVAEGSLRPVRPPGKILGTLRKELIRETGLPEGTRVILPASHDTGSAVAAVPAESGTRWCYLSSGTWSLLGAELPSPCLNESAARYMFTNEAGVGGSIRFLKNIAGLWIVQQCRAHLAERKGTNPADYQSLFADAEKASPFCTLVDPDDPVFASPGGALDKIDAFARKSGQPRPDSDAAYIRCCLDSLALAYRRTLLMLEETLQTSFDRIHVVGGGSRNGFLCQLTADLTGKEVIAGPVEATAVGNGLVQAMGDGEIAHLDELRAVVRATEKPITFAPAASADHSLAAAAWSRFQAFFEKPSAMRGSS
jgi:rhamnulokinase